MPNKISYLDLVVYVGLDSVGGNVQHGISSRGVVVETEYARGTDAQVAL